MKIFLSVFVMATFISLGSCFGQDQNPMSFDFYRIYPAISLTKADFGNAKSILDFNERFNSEWVKDYVSVEFKALTNGVEKSSTSKDAMLTSEQIQLVNNADVNSEISVTIRYYPDNNLSHNDIQEERFKFQIDPESDAKYAGNHKDLLDQIKQKAIDEIPTDLFGLYELAAVGFTVDKKGQIVDVKTLMSTEDDTVNKLLYDTVCDMESWVPAEFSNGTKIKQEYVLTVGNMKSCNTNLINIRAGIMYEEEN